MPDQTCHDGVHVMVPRELMCEGARKLRVVYAITPAAPLYRCEFGYYCLDRWTQQGMPSDVPPAQLFGYDGPGSIKLRQLGGCEAAFRPAFEVKVLEDRGDYELVQDVAGRKVLYFKGRRDGFMPEYLDHPVKDMRTWQEDVKWRLSPTCTERYADLQERMKHAKAEAARGMMIVQTVIGGYMYLRSLIGPADLLYAFHDMPDVIHDCMGAWLDLADAVTAQHQRYVSFDEILFDEDICYKGGPLISPDMMREFLFPYYQQLIGNIKRRQLDPCRHLYTHVATDGRATSVIHLYAAAIGMDVMSPFEVAAGCDVVEIGHQHPGLVLFGGIDKRVLAGGREAIDREVERILPAMRERGGYTPTCDHGVPAEVPYQDYLYYRKRCIELGG